MIRTQVPGLSGGCQLTKDIDSAVDGFVVRRVGDAEVRVVLAEYVAWDNQEVPLDGLLNKLGSGPVSWDPWKDVERSAGSHQVIV